MLGRCPDAQVIMANRSPQTQEKRRREREKQVKRQEKQTRRLERNAAKREAKRMGVSGSALPIVLPVEAAVVPDAEPKP
jgi:hypothetical protein